MEDAIQQHIASVAHHFSTKAEVDAMRDRIGTGLTPWELTVVSRFFPRKGRILDIGCGVGREAFALYDVGFEVIAIDISEGQLTAARHRASVLGKRLEFRRCDGTDLDLADSSFDRVVAWSQVLGNLPDHGSRVHFLRESRRVLHPGGVLSFSGHSLDYCSANHPDCVEHADFFPFGRNSCKWHLFTEEEFRQLCADSSLRILECCNSTKLGSNPENQVLVCVCEPE